MRSYVHDIAAWNDGTSKLDDAEYRVYHVVCGLIYLRDGPIVLNERGLAGMCNQHLNRFRPALARLIETGKLRLVDGKLSNARAAVEIARTMKRLSNLHPGETRVTPGGDSVETRGTNGGHPDRKSLKLNMPDRALGRSKPKNKNLSLSLPLEDSLSLGAAESESHSLGGWDFERFWAQYPHKVGKGRAREMFERVRKKRIVVFDDLMLGLARYAAKTDDRPWCNPATWLYQERWLDRPAENGGQNGGRPQGQRSVLDSIGDIQRLVDEAEDHEMRDDGVRLLPERPVREP